MTVLCAGEGEVTSVFLVSFLGSCGSQCVRCDSEPAGCNEPSAGTSLPLRSESWVLICGIDETECLTRWRRSGIAGRVDLLRGFESLRMR